MAARADLDPAEALRGRLTDADVARRDDLLADEFLALFEVGHRGERTEDQGALAAPKSSSRAGPRPRSGFVFWLTG